MAYVLQTNILRKFEENWLLWSGIVMNIYCPQACIQLHSNIYSICFAYFLHALTVLDLS